jgi:plastocyanin
MIRSLIPAVSAALLIAVTVLFATPGTGAAEEVQIESANFYFCSPSFFNNVCETTITAGDTVVWNNVEGLHTVTQCDDAFEVCPLPRCFDSGFLNPAQSFSQTFETPGTISYWCDIHPVQMRGRIIVEEQVTPTPSPVPTTAPTNTPGAETPTPSPVTTPADVPTTGGTADGESMPPWPLALAVLGVALVSGSGLMLARLRLR